MDRFFQPGADPGICVTLGGMAKTCKGHLGPQGEFGPLLYYTKNLSLTLSLKVMARDIQTELVLIGQSSDVAKCVRREEELVDNDTLSPAHPLRERV